VGGTFFQHKNIHKLTWRSPDGTTESQVEHIIINSRWRRSLNDVRVRRAAYTGRKRKKTAECQVPSPQGASLHRVFEEGHRREAELQK